MTEFEQKLFIAVAKKIKNDNMSLQALSDKVMADVRAYCDKHKKEYKALTDFEKERLTNVRFVLGEISKIKYTREQLDGAIENNLKRIPGNLADESRREELYNVLANLNFKCIYSDTLLVGGGQKIHLDHIIPVNLGGPTDDWNILPICGSCNSSKSDSHLLDWWEKEHTPQDEHKLVYIFEYMANRLLKSLNTKGVKVVTTLTDDEIRKAIELENKERQQEEIKQQTIDLEDDIEEYYEDVEEVKDEKIKRLDAITFLYQMFNHIKLNKQYIISPDNLNQGILDTPSEKDKQRLIDKKFKKLEKLFNSIYKKNKRLTGAKTNIQLLDEQRKMVEYIKSLDIVSYYHISYTYFDELQQMLDQGKTDKEIQEFCNSVDRTFNVDIFIQQLQDFMATHEGRYPKNNAKDEQEKKLARRISKIRQSYKKIKSNKRPSIRLTKEIIAKLEDVNFVWDGIEDWFAPFLEELQQFIKGKGRYPSNSAEDKAEKKLAGQVGNIRIARKKGKGGVKLTDEMINELEEIGFIWDGQSFDFEIFYKELIEYKSKYGDLKVRTEYVNLRTGYNLGGIVSHIRSGKKAVDKWNSLSEEQKQKTRKPNHYVLNNEQYKLLESVGFIWKVDRSFDFDKFYNELMEYKEKYGNLKVKCEYINPQSGYKLGQNVTDIRNGKRTLDKWNALGEDEKAKTKRPANRVLTDEQYKKLTDEGFVWDALSFDFDKFYNELMMYKKEFGDLKVSRSYRNKATGYKLGQSVGCIRDSKKVLDEWNKLNKSEKAKTKRPANMVLTDEQYKMLDDIGFIWDATRSFDFNKFYNELVEYKYEVGNLKVPQLYINEKTGYKLGQNVSVIRRCKKVLDKYNALSEDEKTKNIKSTGVFLTEKQYRMLDNIGFIWDASKKKTIDEQGLSA